jgi:hypothetical protein
MGSTFNNYISYVCCFRICCVVLQVVYHVRVACLFYFQRSFNVLFINCSFLLYFVCELPIYNDVSWFLPLIFVFIQHLNHYSVDLLPFCHICLR